MKKPYILRWSREDMVLSDGSKQKEFSDHDEAMTALEAEIAKITMPFARKDIDISKDRHEHYRIAELEVVREVCGDLKLYGASDYYLRPYADTNAVTTIKFLGSWYCNVNSRFYNDDVSSDSMPWKFFDESNPGECINYYSNLIFHTSDGFVSAPKDDLNNYTTI